MVKCKRCGKPVDSGVVLHSECYDELQHKYQMGYFRGRVLGVECDAERGHAIIEAEREGRLLILPCKEGETVYHVVGKCHPPFGTCPFDGGYGMDRCFGYKKCDAYIEEIPFCVRDRNAVGKSVFLTREEAEAALKGEKQSEV